MSSFAASEVCGPDDRVVADLPPHSYNTGHRVFYAADRKGAVPLRVIVDQHSADQQLLTALQFADRNVVFVPAMASQIVRTCSSRGRPIPPSGRLTRWRPEPLAASRPCAVGGRPRPGRRPRHARGVRGQGHRRGDPEGGDGAARLPRRRAHPGRSARRPAGRRVLEA